MKHFLVVFSIFGLRALFGGEKEWIAYQRSVQPLQQSFLGWCTEEKTQRMMDLIYEIRPKVCVEVGVFGGSSIYPTAAALKYCSQGMVYAIDPWANEECLKGYDPQDPNYQWWSKVDLESILADFRNKMGRYGVDTYCSILRMTAEQAVNNFEDESVDILHIDGNHSEESALSDIKLYFPKVRSGGFIWFDDANWSSTAIAIDYLLQHCGSFIHERSMNTCLLFQKP